MLTQGPSPDPKCKLNISSFFTLPHLLGFLILPEIMCPLYCYYKYGGGWDRCVCGGGGGLTDSYGGQEVVIIS